MGKITLQVTYQVPAHHTTEFEEIFFGRVLPLARTLGLTLSGFWRTVVGRAGSYLELWEFNSISEYESKWKALLGHPEFQEIFKLTGPMVEGETFCLLEPVQVPSLSTSPLTGTPLADRSV